jgi:hypothetical protein
METLTLLERLLKIQNELKAPKNMYNSFGKYNYRNLEGILEAAKPILLKYGVILILTDETIDVGGFPICNAKAKVFCSDYPELSIEVQAQAGIDFSKKGMDWSQSSGSSSSYARKYALNGLFLIDDTKDADATNTHNKSKTAVKTGKTVLPSNGDLFNKAKNHIKNGGSVSDIRKKYQVTKEVEQLLNQ